jgi:hypothetical protein
MELIDRYMHAVGQALPESRRDEIVRELRANILDKLEAFAESQGREPAEAEVSGLLKELGHPQKVAGSFLTGQQLVSTDLFPVYKSSLHYGMIVVFILALIQFGVHFLASGHLAITGFVFAIFHKALIMFACVTGVFYLLSNPVGGKEYFNPYRNWAPEKLPPATRGWQRIHAGEQGVAFASDLFFLLLLNYSLWMPSARQAELAVTFAPEVEAWIPFLSIVLIISLLFGLWNFMQRYWTIPKLIVDAMINLVSALILLTLSRVSPILVDAGSASSERIEALGISNQVIGVSLFWVGIWLLFMAGWRLYRAWQLSR